MRTIGLNEGNGRLVSYFPIFDGCDGQVIWEGLLRMTEFD